MKSKFSTSSGSLLAYVRASGTGNRWDIALYMYAMKRYPHCGYTTTSDGGGGSGWSGHACTRTIGVSGTYVGSIAVRWGGRRAGPRRLADSDSEFGSNSITESGVGARVHTTATRRRSQSSRLEAADDDFLQPSKPRACWSLRCVSDEPWLEASEM